jgi:hypothetical protein
VVRVPNLQRVDGLTEFGRTRLSKTFFMRDFLFSDIASVHGMNNIPSDPELAIAAGAKLCEDLLEPIQDAFGRIAIRSAYRSAEVNGFGNEMQRAGKSGYTCSANEANRAGHIWDLPDAEGHMGATACIIVPRFWDRFQSPGDWTRLAWWIHDHLPYSALEFYPKYWAFNVTWHESPKRRIYSYTEPRGYLTRPGMDNHEGSHKDSWGQIVA